MSLSAWRRNQIAVTAAACLVFAGFTLVLPFLPYYVEQLGVRGRAVHIWAGALLSIAPLLAATMSPIWGRLADRFGMKIMVQRTIAAMIVHWVLMAFATTVWHLLALRIFLGLFSGFATMSVALVTLGAPKGKIGSAIGTLQSAQILAAAAGPLLGGILYETIGLRGTCFVTALFCAGGLVLISLAYDDSDVRARPTQREGLPLVGAGPGLHEPMTIRRIVRLPGFVSIAAILFFATLISRSFGLLAPLYVRQLAGGSARVGLLAGLTVSAGWFAEAASAMVQGRAASRVMPSVLLFTGLALCSVSVMPMVLAASPAVFILLRTMQGLAGGGTLTLGYTMAAAIFPDANRATSFALLSSAALLGGACGPLIAGLMSYTVGMNWVFAVSSIAYAALALLALSGLRREIAAAPAPAVLPPPPYIPVPR